MLDAVPARARAFLLALVLDAILGDPPTVVHPVGWIGRLVRAVEARAPSSPFARRWFGVLGAAVIPWVAAMAARLFMESAREAPRFVVSSALILDSAFALRTLLARADEVRLALELGDLDEARLLLRTHLVSRATDDLTASEVAGAAIESVAENLSDSVIAPWLAFALHGAPGALAYRAVNTLDAMWGYRTPEYAHLGWAAANLDDIVNWVPARATAAAIVASAAVTHEDAAGAFEVWRRDGGATDSPNAGQPMAAMAGALGVTLEKRGAYALGDGSAPVAADIARAIHVSRMAAAISAVAILVPMLRCAR